MRELQKISFLIVIYVTCLATVILIVRIMPVIFYLFNVKSVQKSSMDVAQKNVEILRHFLSKSKKL